MNSEARKDKVARLARAIAAIRLAIEQNPNVAMHQILSAFGVHRGTVIDGLKYLGALRTVGGPTCTTYSWHTQDAPDILAVGIIDRKFEEVGRPNVEEDPHVIMQRVRLSDRAGEGCRYSEIRDCCLARGIPETTFKRQLNYLIMDGLLEKFNERYYLKARAVELKRMERQHEPPAPLRVVEKSEVWEQHDRRLTAAHQRIAALEREVEAMRPICGWIVNEFPQAKTFIAS